MDYGVEGDGVIHIRIDGRIVFQDFALEIKGDNVSGTQGCKRRPKAIHEHFIFANGHAEVTGDANAQCGPIQNARSTTDIPLNAFNRCRHSLLPPMLDSSA
jgi:hypothetical protein